MKKRWPLRSFRLRNFKAVRDTGLVKFGPLTVFIGNNGSGKSSMIEGLKTFRDIVLSGLNDAMLVWGGSIALTMDGHGTWNALFSAVNASSPRS